MALVAQIETPINAAQKVSGWNMIFKVERVCPLDNCLIMLRTSLLANAEILPQARQGSYFLNRIGLLPPRVNYKLWIDSDHSYRKSHVTPAVLVTLVTWLLKDHPLAPNRKYLQR